MNDGVTRRDFLNGASLVIGAGLTPARLFAAEPPLPPARSGLRGSHEGSYEAAHRVALQGESVDIDALPIAESVDIAVVGAGIAGLSAAYFARQRFGARRRILILDNHDDFGGHATRNEFRVGGRLLLSYGGSESLQSPNAYFSREVWRLFGELGIEPKRFQNHFHARLYPSLGLSRGVFFDRENFEQDKLVRGDPMRWVSDDMPADLRNAAPVADFVSQFPMSAPARQELQRLIEDSADPLADLEPAAAEAYLRATPYLKFLAERWRLGSEAQSFFRQRSSDFFGFSIDYVSAAEALGAGFPGRGAKADGADAKTAAAAAEPYIYHFPDGNASIARLLAHALIPALAPGLSRGRAMSEIAMAQFDYAQLDRPDHAVRIRLGSTVLALRNRAGGVDVVYHRNGALRRLRARRAVYCGWSMMLPHICKELEPAQAEAFAGNVKSPIVYAKALVRDWTAFVRAGVHDIYAPTAFYARTRLNFPVSMGRYKFPQTPIEPMVLHFVHVPEPQGPFENARERARAARGMLLGRSFEEYEAAMRDQLQRMLGPFGFAHARDVLAITVNRWSHGYSYMDNSLYDAPGSVKALVDRARRRIGRIACANSDTGYDAYLHAAIDEAARAVRDLASG